MPFTRIGQGCKLPFLREKLKAVNHRLLVAMVCYLVLVVIAAFTLEGFLRAAVLFYFAILVVKTIAHSHDEPMSR